MRLSRVISLTASLCLSGLTTTAIVHAQPAGASAASVPGKEQAKRLFDEGVELEKKNDFVGALAKYKEAEQITTTAGLRFHAGYCLEMTGKLLGALDAYETADKLARDQNKPEVRAAVSARLEPLRARVPQLAMRLTTPATGAEVLLDGAAAGAPPLDGKPVRIDPGEYAVAVRAPGFRTFTRKVLVAESATTTVDVALERNAAPGAPAGAAQPAPTELVEPPHTEASRSRALPITTTALAVVLAGTGIGLYAAAGSAQSTAETECLSRPTCDDQRSKIRTFDALALGSFVGAVGLGVVSVILWTSKTPDRSAAARTWVVASPSSVGVAGAF